MSEILYQISKKSGITIYFVEDDLSTYKTVDCEAKEQDVPTILDELFKNRNLVYNVIGPRYIGVKKIESKGPTSFNSGDTMSVSGRITDENGNYIAGATVQVKGTQKGTITNESGFFSISNISGSDVLTVTSVSYMSREISVKNRRSIGVAELNKLVRPLDDIVVLAYNTTTGRRLTGNVSKVKSKDIENSPVSNPILAVAGRVPGVTISQSSGFSGSGVDINIQGINSLLRGVAPFYVVDGVPFVQSLLPNLGNVQRTSGRGTGDGPVNGSPLSYINPQDIESIEILKDADATAIYGSRAANGAIIITTKRGKAGDMKLELNIQSGFAKNGRRLKLLNTNDYLAMRREALVNDGRTPGTTDYDINGTWDSTRNVDWQKELLGGTANFNDAQLNLSGGTANVQYLVGGNFHRESTVFPSDLRDQRMAFRFNLDGKSKDSRFRITLSNSYLADDNRLPNADLTLRAMTLAPNTPSLKNSDGTLNWAPSRTGFSTLVPHPLAALSSYYSNKTANLISNVALSYEIMSGLLIKANAGYNRLRTDEISTTPASIVAPESRATFTRRASYGFNDINSWIVEPQIQYKAQTKLANIDVLVGSTFQTNNSSRRLILASGFTNDYVLENISAATNLSTLPGSSILSKYKYTAGFFSVNIEHQNKYLLNISGRRDGSSRFGSKNRFHNFAAVGAGWIFTNENFLKQRPLFISYGKLKGSIGSTGNDQIGDYNFLSLYEEANPDVPYRGGALTVSKIANANLQWEETKKLSLGLELGFWNERILLTSVYYRNRSSNMLVPGTLPATAGQVGSFIENMPATIQNTGFEFSLNSINIKTNTLTWNTYFNLTIPRNKLLEFGDIESSTYAGTLIVGQPANFVKLYRAAGVNAETGLYEFYDKDGKITNNPDSDPLNYNRFIDPNPRFYGGIGNTLNCRRFTLDFLFQFVKQLGENIPGSSMPGAGRNNQQRDVINHWRKPGDITTIQKFASATNFDATMAYNYNLFSDAFWQNAAFVRLKNVSLSYDLPTSVLSKLKLRSVRFYAHGQNLLTFTPYKGLDPESKSNFSLPPLRTVTFGAQISL
ncbi:SusC/RagA family TonB-linked outer membrane protein [Chitinophaga sp. YR627]|uniref:SusC/RagA family TonB-linked outer membrane protein n=1 Tax=Chitinophaga sp. YR627 TaxID=1881041 RepID=UPI000A627D5C|nr:SusC/RagA family TonB-linked outer membrane protein [Chitinophaga sp. YR627]